MKFKALRIMLKFKRNASVLSLNTSLACLFALIVAGVACAEEWKHFQYMPEGKGVYDISFIEESGFISKDFHVWLKATYNLDENKCDSSSKPSGVVSNYDYSLDVKRAMELQAISGCMQNYSKRNKIVIYEVKFNCDKKKISALPTTVTNYAGESVAVEDEIKDHPGSIGYEIIKKYCN